MGVYGHVWINGHTDEMFFVFTVSSPTETTIIKCGLSRRSNGRTPVYCK